MGVMSRLDHRGHGPVASWKPEDAESVAVASRVFTHHRERHYTMFDVSNPQKGRRLDAFDVEAKEILAVPRMRAG